MTDFCTSQRDRGRYQGGDTRAVELTPLPPSEAGKTGPTTTSDLVFDPTFLISSLPIH
jgi:hypothetical protein